MFHSPGIQALLKSKETQDTYTRVQISHEKTQIKKRIELYFHHGSYHCQGVCQWASSPGLLFPAGLGEKPSSGDLACLQPARGSCWTGVSEWWHRGWAGCLVPGYCSLPSPWSQYCCRWHHQTAWYPSCPPPRTVKHLRQKRGRVRRMRWERGKGIMER